MLDLHIILDPVTDFCKCLKGSLNCTVVELFEQEGQGLIGSAKKKKKKKWHGGEMSQIFFLLEIGFLSELKKGGGFGVSKVQI